MSSEHLCPERIIKDSRAPPAGGSSVRSAAPHAAAAAAPAAADISRIALKCESRHVKQRCLRQLAKQNGSSFSDAAHCRHIVEVFSLMHQPAIDAHSCPADAVVCVRISSVAHRVRLSEALLLRLLPKGHRQLTDGQNSVGTWRIYIRHGSYLIADLYKDASNIVNCKRTQYYTNLRRRIDRRRS
jgi:hypothetical protein